VSGAEILSQFVVLVLAIALGFELISRVPTLLHTPLMSATNAIHGIVIVGAMVIVLTADDTLTVVLGLVAVFFGAVNVVGGFIVTNRMLEMFRGGARRRRG
jgi:NAD(P) transhydrogenase subunit alpha